MREHHATNFLHDSVSQQAKMQRCSQAQQQANLQKKLTTANGALEAAKNKRAEDAEHILSLEAQVHTSATAVICMQEIPQGPDFL